MRDGLAAWHEPRISLRSIRATMTWPRAEASSWTAKRDTETAHSYFVTIRRGGELGVGAGGEIVNVTQVFQPAARFSAANSL
jgi:hypothetical protein